MEQVRIFASCHNHSTFSDGEYTPETLARIAKNMGHGGIILTDHDTVAGYPFMKAAAEKYEPSYVTRYAIDLATAFNKFYMGCKIAVEDEQVKNLMAMDKASINAYKETVANFVMPTYKTSTQNIGRIIASADYDEDFTKNLPWSRRK